METRLLMGAVPSTYDEQLTEIFRGKDWGGKGTLFVAGFVNDEGVIYRTVSTHGLQELMQLTLACEKLGLVNELFGTSRTHNGCNSLWRKA